jgi:hypothetical protein
MKHYLDENDKNLNKNIYERPILVHKQYLETTWKNSFINGPKVLTWKDLQAGFKVWFWSLSLPVIAFIIEWTVRYLNLLVMRNIFKTFFEQEKKKFRKNDGLIKILKPPKNDKKVIEIENNTRKIIFPDNKRKV